MNMEAAALGQIFVVPGVSLLVMLFQSVAVSEFYTTVDDAV